MLMNQWIMTGRCWLPSWFFYFAVEAEIHNIRCHAIFASGVILEWRNIETGLLVPVSLQNVTFSSVEGKFC